MQTAGKGLVLNSSITCLDWFRVVSLDLKDQSNRNNTLLNDQTFFPTSKQHS